MQVLLTRPLEDSLAMAPAVRARGWQVMIDPLLEIHYTGPDRLSRDYGDCQGYLCTSRNGLRALVQARGNRQVPVYAVGRGTAALAREQGFQTVHDADGDVTDLVDLVRERVKPENGPLLHAAGRDLAGSLVEQLRGAGFQVHHATLYRAETVKRLSADTIDALDAGALDAVMAFSPRSAKCLVQLIEAAGLTEKCRAVQALAISDKAASPLASLPFDNIWVAIRPNQDDMLDLLDQAGGTTGDTTS